MSKHHETLKAVFHVPTLSRIRWSDIEGLLRHLGATITEGRGSGIRVLLMGAKAHFHRPHPRKEASKGAVEGVRDLLISVGISEE